MPENGKMRITPTMTVREVIIAYPDAVNIFNKYGLTGCGGKFGPPEPIGFFASVHQADPVKLLEELNEMAAKGKRREASKAETKPKELAIYRPFVKAAIIIVLSVGCGLGAINLAAMALGGTVGTTWMAVTQAHGHAQIFGWVGLFIMGILYHVLPRLKATELQGKPLAMASFWLVLGGIILRFVTQPFATDFGFGMMVAASAAIELLGVSLFMYVCLATLATAPQARDFYDKYILASIAWFWVTTAATLAIGMYTASIGSDIIPASIDGAYLHIGLMGFVGMMIFGFTLRTVPLFLGLRAPNKKAFDVVFWVLNIAIAFHALGMFAANVFNDPLAPTVVQVATGVEFLGVIAFVYFLNIFRKPEVNISEAGADQGYEKYIRVAYGWLLVAATMSLGYAIYQIATGTEVAHAYIGAYRHALTVGFISMMILGMASRIIPVFTGVRLHSSQLLFATFILVNIGNTLRVLSQPLAGEFGGVFFMTMGISGFIEVTGLALFAYNIWKTMDNAQEEDEKIEASVAEQDDEEIHHPAGGNNDIIKIELPINKNHIVGEVIEQYPATLNVFLNRGFAHLQNEVMRKTLAKTVTIEMASRAHSIDFESLLVELNEVCEADGKAKEEAVA